MSGSIKHEHSRTQPHAGKYTNTQTAQRIHGNFACIRTELAMRSYAHLTPNSNQPPHQKPIQCSTVCQLVPVPVSMSAGGVCSFPPPPTLRAPGPLQVGSNALSSGCLCVGFANRRVHACVRSHWRRRRRRARACAWRPTVAVNNSTERIERVHACVCLYL